MADNFTAEAVNSNGVVFATDEDSSSTHYPLGKIAWGALNTFNITSSTAPFPVQLFGRGVDSAAAVYVGNSSGHPVFVKDENATTVTVTNIAANDTVVTVTANDSASPQFVTNNSAHLVYVRDENSTTVTITGTVPISGNATVTLAAGSTLAATISGNATVTLATGSTLAATVSGNVGNNGLSSAAGAATPITLALSSVAQTVLTAVGRLYGYSVSNPDTAADLWVKIYPDDSGGVTLGTSSAAISQMVPFGGGREAWYGPPGVAMSSGMSVTAAATGQSTSHDAPSTTAYLTLYFVPST